MLAYVVYYSLQNDTWWCGSNSLIHVGCVVGRVMAAQHMRHLLVVFDKGVSHQSFDRQFKNKIKSIGLSFFLSLDGLVSEGFFFNFKLFI